LYQHARYGFFRGSGRNFWLPREATWRDYVRTPRGLWLAGSGVLLMGALHAATLLPRPRATEGAYGSRNPDSRSRDDLSNREGSGPEDRPALPRPGEQTREARGAEVVLTCALLHVAFVTAFFGSENSWVYYSYVLTIGLMGLTVLGRAWRVIVAGVAVLALGADAGLPREFQRQWRGVETRIGGLWTSADSAREWRAVLERIGPRRAALLAMSGCGEVTYADRFLPPVTLFLLNGMEPTRDVRRKAEQLRRAEVVVVPKVPEGTLAFRLNCPAFRAALSAKRVVFEGEIFRVYDAGGSRASAPPGGISSSPP
jgi:hypothetical protein